MRGDAHIDLSLVALILRLGGNGLDGDLHRLGVAAALHLLEVLIAQPLAEFLAAHSMGLAMSAYLDVGKGVAIRGRRMEQHGGLSKTDQDVSLLGLLAVAFPISASIAVMVVSTVSTENLIDVTRYVVRLDLDRLLRHRGLLWQYY